MFETLKTKIADKINDLMWGTRPAVGQVDGDWVLEEVDPEESYLNQYIDECTEDKPFTASIGEIKEALVYLVSRGELTDKDVCYFESVRGDRISKPSENKRYLRILQSAMDFIRENPDLDFTSPSSWAKQPQDYGFSWREPLLEDLKKAELPATTVDQVVEALKNLPTRKGAKPAPRDSRGRARAYVRASTLDDTPEGVAIQMQVFEARDKEAVERVLDMLPGSFEKAQSELITQFDRHRRTLEERLEELKASEDDSDDVQA